jgi:hypothetical protein
MRASTFARRLAVARAKSTPAARPWWSFDQNLALLAGLALMPLIIAGGLIADWAR